MAKLQNYNGHYCESHYEYAFLAFLEEEGWQYLPGAKIPRADKMDVLITADLMQFLASANPDLNTDEIQSIVDTVRLAGAESDFATLHKVYNWLGKL